VEDFYRRFRRHSSLHRICYFIVESFDEVEKGRVRRVFFFFFSKGGGESENENYNKIKKT
jgi:hypothetical protein